MAEVSYSLIFFVLAIFLVSLHIIHKIAKKVKQPMVLGEIFLGFVLGPSFLAILTLNDKSSSLSALLNFSQDQIDIAIKVFLFLVQLAELFLLFEVGLELDLKSLRRAGKSAMSTAIGGIVVPFLAGLGLILVIGDMYGSFIIPVELNSFEVGLFFAATLTATSIGISIRTFMDIDKVDSKPAKVMIGAAVIDDILALTLLTVVLGIIIEEEAAETQPLFDVLLILVSIVVFFIVAFILAQYIFPKLIMPYLEKQSDHYLPIIVALTLLFFMAWLAETLRLAPIIGAFVAGVIINTNKKYSETVNQQMSAMGHWIIPLFFISVGLRINLWDFLSLDLIMLSVLVVTVGIISKVIGSGIFAKISGDVDLKDSYLVGISMAARGEVVLVFVAVALDLGIFTLPLYSSTVMLVVVSAFLIPLWLKASFKMFEGKTQVS